MFTVVDRKLVFVHKHQRSITMCGIVSFISPRPLPLGRALAEALKRLDYRGYDSAGSALLLEDNSFVIAKYANGHDGVPHAGSCNALCAHHTRHAVCATAGIAHTRWATHGGVTPKNAHPHMSPSGRIAVVHNGMLYNFAQLKEMLTARGVVFQSETDTEVIAVLIERMQDETHCSLHDAVLHTLALCEGTYGLVVLSRDPNEPLVAVSHGSPLVMGSSEEGVQWVASDCVALSSLVMRYTPLADGSITTITRDGTVHSSLPLLDEEAVPQLTHAHDTARCAMLAEIREQSAVVARALEGRLSEDTSIHLGAFHTPLPGYAHMRELVSDDAFSLRFIAQGTSFYAGLFGQYVARELLDVPASALYAAEVSRIRTPKAPCLSVFLSQSGETADTRDALRHCVKNGGYAFGMTNRVGSVIARESHAGLHVRAGVETAVASTKAFTAQSISLLLLIAEIARVRASYDAPHLAALLGEMLHLPRVVADVLALGEEQQHIDMCTLPAHCTSLAFLGGGYTFALAGEAALKVQEVAYIHAHAFHLSELKHGPLALVEPGFPVFAFVPNDGTDALVGNALEIAHARGATIYTIGTHVPKSVEGKVTYHFPTPKTHAALFPIVAAPWVQLIAAYTALARNIHPDKPRNLAKSVTV